MRGPIVASAFFGAIFEWGKIRSGEKFRKDAVAEIDDLECRDQSPPSARKFICLPNTAVKQRTTRFSESGEMNFAWQGGDESPRSKSRFHLQRSSVKQISIEAAVLDRFEEVLGLDHIGIGKIGDGASDFENAVVRARRE